MSVAAQCSNGVNATEIILRREYSEDEVLSPAIIANIQPKQANTLLQRLSQELPLQRFGWGHLKRIRPAPSLSSDAAPAENLTSDKARHSSREEGKKTLQIVVCPEVIYTSLTEELKRITSDNEVLHVCRFQPATRQEFELWSKHWPINFHETQQEKERCCGLSVREVDALNDWYHALLIDNEEVRSLIEPPDAAPTKEQQFGGIIVNPVNGRVIATVSRSLKIHKKLSDAVSINASCKKMLQLLHTPTMVCIDYVAAIIRGEIPNDGSLPSDAYLCSGLDLLLMEEPDLMSAMALVHSRIRRVFFVKRTELGALASGCGHIHSLAALNHHYRVFELRGLSFTTASGAVDETSDTAELRQLSNNICGKRKMP